MPPSRAGKAAVGVRLFVCSSTESVFACPGRGFQFSLVRFLFLSSKPCFGCFVVFFLLYFLVAIVLSYSSTHMAPWVYVRDLQLPTAGLKPFSASGRPAKNSKELIMARSKPQSTVNLES